MVGLTFDELKRRDHQRWVRNAVVGSAAAVLVLASIAGLSVFGWRQKTVAQARTLAAESVQATDVREDPAAGLDLAIRAVETSPSTAEARNALLRALEYQRSLLILTHGAEVHRASFSAEGGRILTCGAEPTVRIWNAATGELLREIAETGEGVRICAFSPDGSAVATSAGGATLRLWDAASGALRSELAGHAGPVATAAFSADGSRLASASADGSVRIWDVAAGEVQAVLAVSGEALRAAFFAGDGTSVAAVAEDGRISVWDLATKRRLQEFGEPMPGVHDALMSPDGSRLLVSNYQYRPYLWRLSDPARLVDGAMAMPHAAGAAFSPDGTLLAVGGGDGFVTVFDTEEGYPVKQLQHPDMVFSVAFSPNGRLLATAADKVRIWETPVLGGGVDNEVETLRGHAGEVRVEGFAPGDDARLLTIGVDDRTVRVWDVSAPGKRSRSLGLAGLSEDDLLDLARAKVPVRRDAAPRPADRP
jgi:WD40 repeat protein